MIFQYQNLVGQNDNKDFVQKNPQNLFLTINNNPSSISSQKM